MTEAEQIAAFLAKNGVTKVEAGKSARDERHEREDREKRSWNRRMGAQSLRPRVRMVTDHCGREFFMNEDGEWL